MFFFFQAEDGIRDWSVTGVQTCALPISVLQDFERRLCSDAYPDHPRVREIGEYPKPAEGEGEGARTRRGTSQGGGELRLALVRHVSEKLERQVDALGARPLHR